MRIIKKLVKAAKAIVGQFVAIGNRGVLVTEITKVEAPLVIGKNRILSKVRGENHAAKELWSKAGSWIQSSREVEKDGYAYFQLLPVAQAIKTGQVKLLKGVQFVQKSTGRKFTGDLLMPRDWKEGEKQPRVLGVINARGYSYGRIESKPVV